MLLNLAVSDCSNFSNTFLSNKPHHQKAIHISVVLLPAIELYLLNLSLIVCLCLLLINRMS